MQTPGPRPRGRSSAESKRLRAFSFLPSFQVTLAPSVRGPQVRNKDGEETGRGGLRRGWREAGVGPDLRPSWDRLSQLFT